MTTKILAKYNPNRHGYVKLQQCDEGDDVVYFVTTPDDEDGAEFDGDLAAARAYYDEQVTEYAATPNWEAQAEYDERWGAPLEFPVES